MLRTTPRAAVATAIILCCTWTVCSQPNAMGADQDKVQHRDNAARKGLRLTLAVRVHEPRTLAFVLDNTGDRPLSVPPLRSDENSLRLTRPDGTEATLPAVNDPGAPVVVKPGGRKVWNVGITEKEAAELGFKADGLYTLRWRIGGTESNALLLFKGKKPPSTADVRQHLGLKAEDKGVHMLIAAWLERPAAQQAFILTNLREEPLVTDRLGRNSNEMWLFLPDGEKRAAFLHYDYTTAEARRAVQITVKPGQTKVWFSDEIWQVRTDRKPARYRQTGIYRLRWRIRGGGGEYLQAADVPFLRTRIPPPKKPPPPPPPPDTRLHKAAEAGDLQVIKALLKKGAPINERDKDGRTPMCVAARAGHKDVCGVLAKSGANLSGPLYDASWAGDVDAAALLIGIGAPADHVPRNGLGPLHWVIVSGAALEQRRKLAQLLIENGADINGGAGKEWGAPLNSAAHAADIEMVKFLLKKGADPNVRRSLSGNTPLFLAVDPLGAGGLAVMKMLLDQGADVDARNKIGRTALHRAASRGDEKAVRLLLKHGADVKVKDKKGRTPLDLAEDDEIRELLKKHAHD